MPTCKWLPAMNMQEEILTTADRRKIISKGDIRVEGRFVDASNATLYAVSVLGDQELAVIYKPIAGERALWDFPDGNLANRELAAYLFSEFLAFNIVPFTIIRDGTFGPGMVQEWIEVDESVDVVDLASSDNSRIRQMALFDALINNTDRKYGHILPRSDGQIFGCDHGVTFHQDPKLRTVLWQFAGTPFTEEEKDTIQRSLETSELLRPWITDVEIQAVFDRASQLLETGCFPEPLQDWPSIPWPPF